MNCSHAGCRCTESVMIDEKGRSFCSETCAEAESESSEVACPCGHPDCAAV